MGSKDENVAITPVSISNVAMNILISASREDCDGYVLVEEEGNGMVSIRAGHLLATSKNARERAVIRSAIDELVRGGFISHKMEVTLHGFNVADAEFGHRTKNGVEKIAELMSE